MKKLLKVLFVVMLCFGIVGCSSDDNGGDNNNSSSNNNVKTEKKVLSYGDVVEFDDLEIVFSDNVSFTTIDNSYSDYNNAEVVVVPVSITNKSEETHGLNMFYYTVFGSKGTSLSSISAYFDDNVDWKASEMRSNATVESYMHFLYDGDGDYYVEFNNWTKKVEVKLTVTK